MLFPSMLFIYLFIILKLIYCRNWSIFFLSFQNPCESIPCANHATCQAGFGNHGYRCICPAGYQGVQCITGEGKNSYNHRQRPKTKPNVATNLLAFFPLIIYYYHFNAHSMPSKVTDGVCYTYWPLTLFDSLPQFIGNFTQDVNCLKCF